MDSLTGSRLISQCLKVFLLSFCIDFELDSVMVRENITWFKSFKHAEGCFVAQDIIYLGECSTVA